MSYWLYKSFPLRQQYCKPEMYLVAKVHKIRYLNGLWAWTMSPIKNVQEAVRNCIIQLAANYVSRFKLPKKAENAFKRGYDPELNTSPELDIIGVLQWMIKLEMIDIVTKVSLFSSHVAVPRKGHLDVAVHVMVHINQR